MSASPAGPTSAGFEGYPGCDIFEYRSESHSVPRDANGAPVLLRTIDAPGNRFVGACAYAEAASLVGYFVPELMMENAPRVFHIFASGVIAP